MAVQADPKTTASGEGNGGGAWPRYLNAAIAVWLFVSAFVWRHSLQLRQDTSVVAVLIFAAAVIALGPRGFRWVNTVLAAWLFVSTLAIPHVSVATLWNNLIVACVVFILSLVPTTTQRIRNIPAPR